MNLRKNELDLVIGEVAIYQTVETDFKLLVAVETDNDGKDTVKELLLTEKGRLQYQITEVKTVLHKKVKILLQHVADYDKERGGYQRRICSPSEYSQFIEDLVHDAMMGNPTMKQNCSVVKPNYYDWEEVKEIKDEEGNVIKTDKINNIGIRTLFYQSLSGE